MPGHDANVGAKRAREARAALGLDAAEPFGCLLTAIERDAGVPVVVAGMPDEIAGFCLWLGDGSSCVFVNGLQYVGRQRFTLAHEYGHHFMRHEGAPPDSTRTVIQGFARSAVEVQANAFAAELLAPADAIRSMVDREPTLETLAELAGHFGISMHAALVRVNNLGLTGRDAALWIELADADLRRWVRPSERGDELARIQRRLPRVSAMLHGSLLHATLSGDAAASPGLSRALSLLMR
jgi:Zn-dependent peptidase ImmA (M78 family)